MGEDKKDDEPKKGKKEGAEGDDGAPVVVPVDVRVMWFEDKVCSSLKIKTDKWKKLISINENVETIYTFLDNNRTTILFYLNQKEDLIPALDFPVSLKRRSVYFLKRRPGAPITEKLDTELITGDISANPLEFLSTVLEEVYLPLLTNPKNLESWPDVVSSDVLRHFHQLNGAVYVISGKAKGKTMLPLPHGAKSMAASDKSILHTLESAVIDWTHQIKEVIKSDSSAALEGGSNPGPIIEIDFWAAKAANLKSIHQQLTDEQIQKISKILQSSKSTYFPAFQSIFDEVVFALEEASDINTYLKALRPQVERLASAGEIAELSQIFPGLMHTLLLIWKSSNHYNTPNRMTVVLQEICNDIIEQARNFLQPAELFSAEPEEAAERLRLVIRICDSFKSTYFECKTSIVKSSNPWNFDSRLLFGRLDKFLVRVQHILELFETIIEFNRLEKIEIGGTKGKILSFQVAQIFSEFVTALSGFSKLKYDVLDISLFEFDVDLNKFHEKITDLDCRIGHPPIHYNMAPVTGSISWIHELNDRITKAMDKLKRYLNHSVMNTNEANIVKSKYNELRAALDAFELNIFNIWTDTIIDESEENLNKPVLIREASLLKVNFDPKVVALLREVTYFGALAVQLPQEAVNIYSKAETFRKYIFSLESIANMYNGIRTGVMDVEKPLIEAKIKEIDAQIEQGVSSINWNYENNMNQIAKILKQWSASRLLSVKTEKASNLEEMDVKIAATNDAFKKDGQLIISLVEQTRLIVEAEPETEQWSRYREYVDVVVKKGVWTTIKSSLEYILQNMDKERATEVGPILEANSNLKTKCSYSRQAWTKTRRESFVNSRVSN
ncbi:hypothetical protein BASA62_009917 [Batrachochytrium salamandrivorans]|nr:hypothetical protein BASA62_009917 [Batrachochytrium salamandrivorans]